MKQPPVHHKGLTLLVRALVWAGRMIGQRLPWYNHSGLFFFFPFYHTGGAEKVHADIVNCFTNERPWVFFVKRSHDRTFWQSFSAAARCFDRGWLLKYTYPFSVGVMAGLIGRHANPRVFGCNALFYYLLLPHLPEQVRATDLLHGLGGGAEQFALPVLDRLAERVVITAGVQRELLSYYRDHQVDPALDSRITVVCNRVDLPEQPAPKPQDGQLRLLFVGRGSPEKRVHLIGRVARRCAEQGLPVQVTLVGAVAGQLEEGDQVYCQLTGPLTEQAEIARSYQQADLLLITSSREGFPLTVMEGMAQGCVPVCTAVGGIPEHIRHLENGWLLPAGDDDAVVNGLMAAVKRLADDRQTLERLSAAAYAYACQNFSGERFCEQYRSVITGLI